MKRLTTSFPHRTAIVVVFALPALFLGWTQQKRAAAARAEVARAQAAIQDMENRIQAATETREAIQQQILDLRDRRLNTLLAVKQAEERATNSVPDDRWATPPEAPEWTMGAPYVWLNKQSLSRMRGGAFSRSGEVLPEMAASLALSEEQRRSVNNAMRTLLNDYRMLEAAKGERAETPPTKEGDSVRISVNIPPMPEEGARLKQQIESALERELGAQRKEILMTMGESWFSQEVNNFGRDPRTVSAKKYADGTFGVNVGHSSMRGPMRLSDHLPSHLAGFFDALHGTQ